MHGLKTMFCFRSTFHLCSPTVFLRLLEQIPAKRSKWDVPAYRFHICRTGTNTTVGYISLRVGDSEITRYSGHVGYEVYPDYRGRDHSRQATLVIAAFAREHGMSRLTLTVNPGNTPSRRIVESLGARFEGLLHIPGHLHHIYPEPEREKCVYDLSLTDLPMQRVTRSTEENSRLEVGMERTWETGGHVIPTDRPPATGLFCLAPD